MGFSGLGGVAQFASTRPRAVLCVPHRAARIHNGLLPVGSDVELYPATFSGRLIGFKEAEVEDLFPEAEYLSAMQTAYSDVTLDFTAEERALNGVANKVTALFKRKGLGKLDKWKPAAVLRDRILADPGRIAEKPCQDATRIFTVLNGLFLSKSRSKTRRSWN